MRVWKYPAQLTTNVFGIQIPQHGKPLSVQRQGSDICLWVSVDPTEPTSFRLFVWIATGEEFPTKHVIAYIGTVQIDQYVFHLFEVENF